MTRTILLADDSVTIQKVVELTFLDEDFRVVSFGNGSDAIARLGEIRPDIVLADVHMPGADGYELCAAAKRTVPGTPVLLLVGTFEVFDADQAAQAGAEGHLKKPFDSQELLRRVKELVASAPEAPQDAAGDWSMSLEAPAESQAAEPESGGVGDAGDWSFEPIAEEGFDLAAAGAEEVAPIESLPPAFAPAPTFDLSQEESLSETELEEPVPALQAMASVPTPPVAEPAAAAGPLSEEDVDRIARRVVELLGERVVRDVAWDVVPDLAEVLVKERLRELEASVE